LMEFYGNKELESQLKTDELCGEFEVQHKSAEYFDHTDDKYKQGYSEKIYNCSLQEIRGLDDKIDKKAYNGGVEYKSPALKKEKRKR
jgi:hypothetical protein